MPGLPPLMSHPPRPPFPPGHRPLRHEPQHDGQCAVLTVRQHASRAFADCTPRTHRPRRCQHTHSLTRRNGWLQRKDKRQGLVPSMVSVCTNPIVFTTSSHPTSDSGCGMRRTATVQGRTIGMEGGGSFGGARRMLRRKGEEFFE
jgi:hypothetical protein